MIDWMHNEPVIIHEGLKSVMKGRIDMFCSSMKKVLVIGCPGSGKSTFSRALHQLTNLPLYHLDLLYWNADKTTVERDEFLKRLHDVLQRDEWIIDGNYASSLEMRLSFCDTVFFLDYPVEVCLEGVRLRKGKPRSDMPWIEMEDDGEFIEFIKKFNEQIRPEILKLLQKYPDKEIYIFKCRDDADCFL